MGSAVIICQYFCLIWYEQCPFISCITVSHKEEVELETCTSLFLFYTIILLILAWLKKVKTLHSPLVFRPYLHLTTTWMLLPFSSRFNPLTLCEAMVALFSLKIGLKVTVTHLKWTYKQFNNAETILNL